MADDEKKILGLIPARGGSKGIPKSNIFPLRGKPLLAYTCEAAIGSGLLTRTLLSTDSREIADVGKAYGVEVPFFRPDNISGDATPSIDVVLHALDWLQEHDGWVPDAVVLLQPTSPLRLTRHIDEALELFLDSGVDTVVSVIPVPHRFHPYSVMQRDGQGYLVDFLKPEEHCDKYRRQDLPILLARNGPAVLVTKTATLRTSRGFYGDKVLPYEMDVKYSIDIDEPFDLQLTELLLDLVQGDSGCAGLPAYAELMPELILSVGCLPCWSTEDPTEAVCSMSRL